MRLALSSVLSPVDFRNGLITVTVTFSALNIGLTSATLFQPLDTFSQLPSKSLYAYQFTTLMFQQAELADNTFTDKWLMYY